jgi:hypothetical protein
LTLIFLACCHPGKREKRAAPPQGRGRKATPTLTSRAEMLSNSGFPARISCKSVERLLVLTAGKQNQKEYLLWRVAGLNICEMSLAPKTDETSDPILHFILL